MRNQPGLLGRHPREELNKFSQGDSVFQVFEQCRHRDPGAAEHPGTTDALRILLHRGAASPAEFGLRAHGPIVAGLFQGKQLDAFELLPLQRSSRRLVLHQKRLDPVVMAALADPISDRGASAGPWNRLRKALVNPSRAGRGTPRTVAWIC